MGGCGVFGERQDPEGTQRPQLQLVETSEMALADELRDFVEFAERRIVDVTSRIEDATADREVRRAALLWKLEVLAEMQTDLADKAPAQMLVDTWALWVRIAEYLRRGAGQNIFGRWQSDAVSAAGEILTAIEAVGRRHLSPERHAQLVRQIDAYAREHPIQGIFEHEMVKDFAEADEGRNLIQQWLGAPFRAVGQVGKGLDPTARLAQSVDRMTELLRDYPAMVRWQAQLLALDLERLTAVETVVASVQRFAETAAELQATAAGLPEQTRGELETLLETVDARQGALQQTVAETRDAIAAADAALARADGVAERVERISAAAVEAGEAWRRTAEAAQATVAAVQGLTGRGKAGATGGAANEGAAARPRGMAAPSGGDAGAASAEAPPGGFDIAAYTETAATLEAATVELRLLLADLEAFLTSETLAAGEQKTRAVADEVLAEAEGRLVGVVDHLFWRALQLVVIAVAVVGGVQVVVGRTRPGRK